MLPAQEHHLRIIAGEHERVMIRLIEVLGRDEADHGIILQMERMIAVHEFLDHLIDVDITAEIAVQLDQGRIRIRGREILKGKQIRRMLSRILVRIDEQGQRGPFPAKQLQHHMRRKRKVLRVIDMDMAVIAPILIQQLFILHQALRRLGHEILIAHQSALLLILFKAGIQIRKVDAVDFDLRDAAL